MPVNLVFLNMFGEKLELENCQKMERDFFFGTERDIFLKELKRKVGQIN